MKQSRFGFNSEWLKDSQLTVFYLMLALCLSKLAAKSKRGRNEANFVEQSNRITVITLNSSFYVFHIDFRRKLFLFSMLAICHRDESCTGKLAPITPKDLNFVAQTDFRVHI